MKTKEFIEKVEALGYAANKLDDRLLIEYPSGIILAGVSSRELFVMNTDTYEFNVFVSDQDAKNLATIMFDYAATPIADREEEKLYWLLLNAPEAGTFPLCRTKGHGIGGTNLNVFKSNINPLLIFTESEIEEMDITGFVKEKVE